MKKKLMLFLLAALMLTTSAFAVQIPDELMQALYASQGEPVTFTIKEDAFHSFKDVIGPGAQYAAIIENPGTVSASVNQGELQLLDKDGNIVSTIGLYGSTPYEVAPGGIAYVVQGYISLSEEDAARVASYKATIVGSTFKEEPAYPTVLPVTAAYAQTEVPDYFGEGKTYDGRVTVQIENNTAATAYDAQVISVLRGKDGKLLAIGNTMAHDVGILPGTTIELLNRISGGLVTKLVELQTEPATVESFAFVAPEDN